MSGGVTIDLLQAADRVFAKHEATEHKNFPKKKNFLRCGIIVDEEVSVGVKTGGSRVGGLDLYV